MLLLTYAALALVLRKDLSLNRRLYRWLLGPNEESSRQADHFTKAGLQATCESLRVSYCH